MDKVFYFADILHLKRRLWMFMTLQVKLVRLINMLLKKQQDMYL